MLTITLIKVLLLTESICVSPIFYAVVVLNYKCMFRKLKTFLENRGKEISLFNNESPDPYFMKSAFSTKLWKPYWIVHLYKISVHGLPWNNNNNNNSRILT